MNVELVAVTNPVGLATPEELIVYCARVSSPRQNDHETGARLIRYCMDNGHWSIFEQAGMTLEITTSRAISAQILRHRSFSFQEFSQRYAEVADFETYDARRQDITNRQNSIDDMDCNDRDWFLKTQGDIQNAAYDAYNEALDRGIAKECARFLLPMSTQTRLYMTGSVRSWIHYFQSRLDESTQLEHREIARAAFRIFAEQFPITAGAL